MEMIFTFFRDIWLSITNLLNSYQLNIGGVYIGIFNLMLAFVIVVFIISVFWKGARK